MLLVAIHSSTDGAALKQCSWCLTCSTPCGSPLCCPASLSSWSNLVPAGRRNHKGERQGTEASYPDNSCRAITGGQPGSGCHAMHQVLWLTAVLSSCPQGSTVPLANPRELSAISVTSPVHAALGCPSKTSRELHCALKGGRPLVAPGVLCSKVTVCSSVP
jgi:hypothetical protein